MNPAELPAHLAERVRTVGDRGHVAAGELVLYWMHHAVRSEENPALDVATVAAATLGLPLLVYQGLGGRHPYDSDRHHTFILEGARDVAARLAARGMRHVFHLPRAGATGFPLRALATRAALVVTEDFPAPPFPAWTRRLAHRIEAPVWRVDTACVLPMRLAERAFARAFEFRQAHGEELLRRAGLRWPASEVVPSPFEGHLEFEPLDLEHADLPTLSAACEIDHSVGPVPGTRGGAGAALSRWRAFVEAGLASYDRLRNDAAVESPRGVSRISAYLHHGHVSPLRVAREAVAHDSSGAEKFLDELLIWRELAHNFCFHHEHLPGGLATLQRLPGWAQDSLHAHAGDARESDYDHEQLARGQTGDELWDAAQRSLLIHGELHNNLRMTWGKSFLGWTPTPERALAAMLELNHRYALDGSDPNSYAGLLYCLGLFDRPFSPAQPVTGAIRSRSTRAHARRLDLAAYRTRANSRGAKHRHRVAVIGAGIAGLAAARTLNDQGFAVQIFERGRGVGGRTAHRRTDGYHFDHGAQYYTVRDPRFARQVEAWMAAGLVAPWEARIASLGDRQQSSAVTQIRRYVGTPGMNAMAKHMARDLDVTTSCTVTGLVRDASAWYLETAAGALPDPVDAVVLAMPPEQLVRLAAPVELLAVSERVELQPCWCAMAAFDAPLLVDFDGAFVNGTVLEWIARDSSKPGRPTGERWVIHAGARWSTGRLDEPSDSIARALLEEFFAAVRLRPREPEFLTAHRWSFARPAGEARAECLWRAELAVASCGDWCRGGRVEGAYLSGIAAAGRVAGASVAHQGIG